MKNSKICKNLMKYKCEIKKNDYTIHFSNYLLDWCALDTTEIKHKQMTYTDPSEYSGYYPPRYSGCHPARYSVVAVPP